MSTPIAQRALPLLGILAVLLGGMLLWAPWQGPRLPAYRVEARPLVQNVVASGRVVTPSRVQIGSEITGMVLERYVQEGDAVQAGDLLLRLRADELQARVGELQASLDQLERLARPQAEAALREALATWQQASREAARRADLFARGLIAREALEQAQQGEIAARAALQSAQARAARVTVGDADEQVLRQRLAAAQAALDRTQIRATVPGIVLTRRAEPGDVVQPGMVLFDLARAGPTEILVPLDEKHLGVLALGQRATCVADAYPGRAFDARVSLIAPGVDVQRGTVDVRLTVEPALDYLRQDMTVSVNIQTGRRASALALPNDALRELGGGRAQVQVLREGRVRTVPVELGLRGLAASEISAGLAAGELVLAAPDRADGSRARADPQPFPGSSAPPPQGP